MSDETLNTLPADEENAAAENSSALPSAVEEEETAALAQAEEEQPEEEAQPLDPNALLEVRHLKKHFPAKKDFFGRPVSFLKAVDDVSFKIEKGTTLGIVGESGCGKTTLGRTILRLQPATDGEVYFDGVDINKLNTKQMNALRPQMQIIFQDPYSSLSPRMPVGEIIGEAVAQHKLVPKTELKEYVLEVMKSCGLPYHYYERYPHEFSGGQRQRICIATALALKPRFVVCDEPVSALDVSIQAQIINLLKDMQEKMGLTYIFISHDLSVVEHISNKVGVMYLGSLVEYASTGDIFDNSMHPYTEALFSAVPIPDPDRHSKRIILSGDIPSPINAPAGCKFHTRCNHCMDICREVAPKFKDYGNGHMVACHLYPQD